MPFRPFKHLISHVVPAYSPRFDPFRMAIFKSTPNIQHHLSTWIPALSSPRSLATWAAYDMPSHKVRVLSRYSLVVRAGGSECKSQSAADRCHQ